MTPVHAVVWSVQPAAVPLCCALVAVKRRSLGKSQLAPCLSPQARVSLIRDMLGNVLCAASSTPCIERTVVVSPERDTVPDQIELIADEGLGLNEALTQARFELTARGVRWLLVLPADLPQVSAADLQCLAEEAAVGGIAIAPDEAGSGTNALCLRTDLPFVFCFGPGSRAKHVAEAQRLGVAARVVRRPGLAMDIDLPDQLNRLQRAEVTA